MNRLTLCSALLVVALGASACSSLQPVKEIVTVPTVVDSPQIEAPAIRIVPRPGPVELKNADLVVVTESNIDEVIQRVRTEQGDFVLYAMTAQSFESLALNFEQIKKFIEEQNAIILYYEEAVTPKDD